ncbi:hypothetical protein [Hydrotalea sandarakina]|uniref:Outer membrane protein with beta-barrel domain n=1 Tax=Hydrotalea sandarakina TaxID=1004304 RepID=A0A2W7RTV7_9BACT|nr:hypothetical protein [Hydrotalea sandarakina]PZX63764.1 hypothetical protein LX80_01422 [Hydrotalea sandarakina]
MKFFLSCLLLILCSSLAHAQLEQGTWLVGGSGSYYNFTALNSGTNYSTDSKYTQISLSPYLGIFILNKFAIGLLPTFSSVKGKVTSTGGLSTNVQRYRIGPFVRYYILNASKQFNIVTALSYQYGVFGGIASGKLTTFSALAGPVIYFNSVVGLEMLLGYDYSKEMETDVATNAITKGLKLSIGFQIHLKK